jgi:hypothetical protein
VLTLKPRRENVTQGELRPTQTTHGLGNKSSLPQRLYLDDAVQVDSQGWNTAGIRHCSFPYSELVEGNVANQAGMDDLRGGTGYLTFYRNHFSGRRSPYE